MPKHDSKNMRSRDGDADWLAALARENLDLKSLAEAAQRRHAGSPTGRSKQDEKKPETEGPSPWVADFLLNQTDGARPAPRRVPQQFVHPKAVDEGERSDPPRNAERTPDAQAKCPRVDADVETQQTNTIGIALPSKAVAPPPPMVGLKARSGGKAGQWIGRSSAIGLGLAGAILATTETAHLGAPPGGDVQSNRLASATDSEPEKSASRKADRGLPVRSTEPLPAGDTIRAEAYPVSVQDTGDGPSEAVSARPAPVTTIAAAAPEPVAALYPSQAARLAPAPKLTRTIDRPAVSVTARHDDQDGVADHPSVVDEPDATLQASTGAGSGRTTSADDQPTPEASAAMRPERKAADHRTPSRASARSGRRQERRPASARFAQARSFSLPSALRPTPF